MNEKGSYKRSIYFLKQRVNMNFNSKYMMKNPLILRVAFMNCIFLGGLLATIATSGKEWQKLEGIGITYTAELWEYCYKETYHDDSDTRCVSVNDILRYIKSSIKGNYSFMSIESDREYSYFLGIIKLIQS